MEVMGLSAAETSLSLTSQTNFVNDVIFSMILTLSINTIRLKYIIITCNEIYINNQITFYNVS